jgi:hypothetical protein
MLKPRNSPEVSAPGGRAVTGDRSPNSLVMGRSCFSFFNVVF